MSRRTTSRLVMLLSGLVMTAALVLLFRPQPISNIISPPGEDYRSYYTHGQIRVFGFEPVPLTPEETTEFLAILDEAKVTFWGFQKSEPYLDKDGNPQLYHLYFSDKEISTGNAYPHWGQVTYLSHRDAFWSGGHLYRLLGKANRQAFAQLLETHRPTVSTP